MAIDVAETRIKRPAESLPPCRGCGKADCFEVGQHDFSEQIRLREETRRKRAQLENGASNVIQRAYRSYLRRVYGTAQARVALAERFLHYQAATTINAVVRGRLDRRYFFYY